MDLLSLIMSLALILTSNILLVSARKNPIDFSKTPEFVLAKPHDTCIHGEAWFMCCEKWKGGADIGRLKRDEFVRLSESVVSVQDVAASMCSRGSLTSLENAQYKVRCAKPSELVCCRPEEGPEETNGTDQNESACQVMADYEPDEIGFNGAKPYFDGSLD